MFLFFCNFFLTRDPTSMLCLFYWTFQMRPRRQCSGFSFVNPVTNSPFYSSIATLSQPNQPSYATDRSARHTTRVVQGGLFWFETKLTSRLCAGGSLSIVLDHRLRRASVLADNSTRASTFPPLTASSLIDKIKRPDDFVWEG